MERYYWKALAWAEEKPEQHQLTVGEEGTYGDPGGRARSELSLSSHYSSTMKLWDFSVELVQYVL
jgi:hypothetical protein